MPGSSYAHVHSIKSIKSAIQLVLLPHHTHMFNSKARLAPPAYEAIRNENNQDMMKRTMQVDEK